MYFRVIRLVKTILRGWNGAGMDGVGVGSAAG